MSDAETPDLPDPQTLRGVADALDEAQAAIGALHLGDVDEEAATELRKLARNLREYRSRLREDADYHDPEGADE